MEHWVALLPFMGRYPSEIVIFSVGGQMDKLVTKRLTIRRFKKADGEDLYEYLSDADVVRYEPYRPFTKEAAYNEAERRVGSDDFWAVCLKEEKMIGNIYFSTGDYNTGEIGYVFNKRYWGHGYACEAVKTVMNYALDVLEVRRITASCDPLNERSWRLLERVGMRREGTLIQIFISLPTMKAIRSGKTLINTRY